MTFTGLYMYNNAKADVEKGEKKMRRVEATRDMMLPTTKEDSRMMLGSETPPQQSLPNINVAEASGMGRSAAYGRPRGVSISQSLHPPSTHNHHLHRPSGSPTNLFIKTVDTSIPTIKENHIASPVDSYPSPPPSIDSPSSNVLPLPSDHAIHPHHLVVA